MANHLIWIQISCQINTFRPPRAYKCLCMRRRIVGMLFPRESNESCIDSVETPKTLVLQEKSNVIRFMIELITEKKKKEAINGNNSFIFLPKLTWMRRAGQSFKLMERIESITTCQDQLKRPNEYHTQWIYQQDLINVRSILNKKLPVILPSLTCKPRLVITAKNK